MAFGLNVARLPMCHAASNTGAGLLLNAIEASMARSYANEMAIRVTSQAPQMSSATPVRSHWALSAYPYGTRFGALSGGIPQIQRAIIADSLL